MEGRKMLWFAVVGSSSHARRRARADPKGREACANQGDLTGLRRGDVQHVLCGLPWQRWQGQWARAASALKVPPPDLTVLSKNNKGSYPSLKVSAIIRGEQPLPAHGSKDMPVWGSLFWKMSQGHESEVQQRIANLNKYVEGMQQK